MAHAAWRVPNARITLEKGVAALRVWLDDDQCAAAPAQGFLVPFQLEAAHDPVVLRFVGTPAVKAAVVLPMGCQAAICLG